ncbi:hypothetical protein HETIRDRAFT_417710 [Heterobasidion irregulare TC 32-1]|uniref:WD40 repeat-like protein n=1 Tax=Heterobasidion irregulare (strain TC 32-1) TaxID=747525 RepID=W4K736_HETIT|nr:uncharacterized protein HETIRDRAFT_417710 [Heterobasidion irregulare TC 32-1]ETW81618.1 hypothetical protein HETIRDRAFT_417710 [Heterobasidion irregulare TC 32-1]
MGDSFGLLSSWDSPVTDRIADISNHLSDWTALYSLGSPVSSICMSKSITAATSFGPRCKIVVQDSARLARDDITVLTPDKKLIYDVWTCDLADRAIVLGDIENPDKFRALDVNSDVLALHQKQNLVYTGARNGSIRRFDMREGSSGHPVFDDKFTPESANSVIYMNGINESQLLISTIRGEISLHDLRFSRGMQSIMTYSGHVGSYRHNLPHAISPCQSYLFAAGQDNRIRAWSLVTGAQLSSPIPVYTPSRRKAHANPLAAHFEGDVTALQVLETGKETVLFATSGQRLHIFPLGQCSNSE